MSSEPILPARSRETRVPLSLQFEFERGIFRIEGNSLDGARVRIDRRNLFFSLVKLLFLNNGNFELSRIF